MNYSLSKIDCREKETHKHSGYKYLRQRTVLLNTLFSSINSNKLVETKFDLCNTCEFLQPLNKYFCLYIKITVFVISRCRDCPAMKKCDLNETSQIGTIVSKYLGSGGALKCSAFQLELEWNGLGAWKKAMPQNRPWGVGTEDINDIYIEEKVFNSGINSSTLVYLHMHAHTPHLSYTRTHTHKDNPAEICISHSLVSQQCQFSPTWL